MGARFSIRYLFWLCCVVVIPSLTWGHHSGNTQSSPKTPSQEEARALVSRGIRHLAQQDYRQAIMAFQVATQLNPEEADAYFSWGVALGALGQRHEEIEKYQQAVRYDPTLGEGYVAWALALFQLGQEAQARAKILEGLAAAPNAISPTQLTILKGLGLVD